MITDRIGLHPVLLPVLIIWIETFSQSCTIFQNRDQNPEDNVEYKQQVCIFSMKHNFCRMISIMCSSLRCSALYCTVFCSVLWCYTSILTTNFWEPYNRNAKNKKNKKLGVTTLVSGIGCVVDNTKLQNLVIVAVVGLILEENEVFRPLEGRRCDKI